MAQRQTGIKRFTQLVDCPQSYTGLGNRLVSVKGTENGLETVAQSVGPVSTFLALSDTPASYAGAGHMTVRVNVAENALEFADESVLVTNITLTLTRADNIILVNAALGDITITLPGAGTITGHVYNIKRIDSSTSIVKIVPSVGGQTIDGAANYLLNVQYQSVTLVASGGVYYII